jgi:hypothetical protein
VEWKEVESLATTADREYFGDDQSDADLDPGFPQLTPLGSQLFDWLDDPEGWLRAGLANDVMLCVWPTHRERSCEINPCGWRPG